MGNRFSFNTRQWIYRYLIVRDGDCCQRCGKIPAALYGLEVDHIDGNPKNNNPSNLQLLCKNCNIALRNTQRAYSAHNEREREIIEGKPATRIAKEEANYRDGSPEMKANLLFEVTFRRWLLGEINTGEGISKKEAIQSGAELVGCSPLTTRRYLEKLTCKAGCLKEEKDALGHPYLVMKPNFEMGLTPGLQYLSVADLIKQADKIKHRNNGNGHKRESYASSKS